MTEKRFGILMRQQQDRLQKPEASIARRLVFQYVGAVEKILDRWPQGILKACREVIITVSAAR